MKYGWLAAYMGGIALALWARSAALVVLAVGLPGALALLPPMRTNRALSFWTVLTVAGTLGFWLLSGSGTKPAVVALLVLTTLAGGFFFGAVRGQGKLRFFLTLLAVFAMLVGYFSSGAGGAGPMLKWLLAQGYSLDQAKMVTLAFRKTIHFTFYGTVAWTTLQAARQTTDRPWAAIRTALLAAASLAAFDELRQSGYANRTGNARDVLLDLTGAFAFVGLSEWRRGKGR